MTVLVTFYNYFREISKNRKKETSENNFRKLFNIFRKNFVKIFSNYSGVRYSKSINEILQYILDEIIKKHFNVFLKTI